jgi:hypothetical protein
MADKKISFDKLGKALSSTGTYVANNKKPLLYVGGAIAIVVIGYAVVKRIKGGIAGEKIKGGKWNSQMVDKSKTSITEATASNYAEQLFKAFNYTYGTDKAIIDSIFSKINSEDFKLIYNAYGTRSYSSLFGIGGTPSAVERLAGTYSNIDLIQWINNELEFGDGALKTKIKKVVEPAGFTIGN